MYTRTSGFSQYQRVFLLSWRARASGKASARAGWPANQRRGVAQLAEQRSPKPQVAGSSPVAPASVDTGTSPSRTRLNEGAGGERRTRRNRRRSRRQRNRRLARRSYGCGDATATHRQAVPSTGRGRRRDIRRRRAHRERRRRPDGQEGQKGQDSQEGPQV